MKCEECGFDYTPEWSASRHAHIIAHYEWSHGVHLRQRQAFEHLGQVEGFRILLVRPSSSLFARRQAERVSRRSIREPAEEGGYDKPQYYAEGPSSPPELFSHAVLLNRDTHGVGIVVIERRPIIQFYRWTMRPHFELAFDLEHTVRWAIVHAWLLPELRGQGVATKLVSVAIQGVNETPDTIGWLSPFTVAGQRLVARLTVTGFHRAGHELPPRQDGVPPFRRK